MKRIAEGSTRIFLACGLSLAYFILSFLFSTTITVYIFSKLRIIIILLHKFWLILPRYPSIQQLQIYQHYYFPLPFSTFLSMEMHIYGLFEWKYVRVFWIQVQVQHHFDIVRRLLFSGACVDTAFAEDMDVPVLSFLHIC